MLRFYGSLCICLYVNAYKNGANIWATLYFTAKKAVYAILVAGKFCY